MYPSKSEHWSSWLHSMYSFNEPSSQSCLFTLLFLFFFPVFAQSSILHCFKIYVYITPHRIFWILWIQIRYFVSSIKMLTRYAHIHLAPNYLKNSDANKVHRFSNTFTRFQKFWKWLFFQKAQYLIQKKSLLLFKICE